MPSTVRDLTELTTVADGDYLLISDTSDVVNRDKRITRLNLVGANIYGGGSINTNGFTLTVPTTGTAVIKSGNPTAGRVVEWLDSYRIQDSGIAAADVVKRIGTFTTAGHLPKFYDDNTINGSGILYTDVVKRIDAQNIAGVKTFSSTPVFSAGVSLGNETFASFMAGSFVPRFSFAGGDGGHTTSTMNGTYLKINGWVFYEMDVRMTSLGTASGVVRIADLPFTTANNKSLGYCRWSGMATAFSSMVAQASTNFLLLEGSVTGGATSNATQVTAANMGNSTTFLISGSYYTTQ